MSFSSRSGTPRSTAATSGSSPTPAWKTASSTSRSSPRPRFPPPSETPRSCPQLADAALGRHPQSDNVWLYQGKKVTIESDLPLALQRDGDLGGSTPATFNRRPPLPDRQSPSDLSGTMNVRQKSLILRLTLLRSGEIACEAGSAEERSPFATRFSCWGV